MKKTSWTEAGVFALSIALAGCWQQLEPEEEPDVAVAESALSTESDEGRDDYTLFEAGQVRPLALSADRKLLFAVNTPDDRLEVFRVQSRKLKHAGSLSVGLRPVSVAVRNAGEVWVVNHLSDSISVVAVDAEARMRVRRTLLVGDEPRDIVFAGPGRNRAFVTTAHRGQNRAGDPQLTTPGVGRADVWVFDANNLGAAAGGNPLTTVTLFADTPRALAASPDGRRVYVAAFNSGNQTTTVDEAVTPPRSRRPTPQARSSRTPGPSPS